MQPTARRVASTIAVNNTESQGGFCANLQIQTFLAGFEPTKHADAANDTISVSHCFHSARLCHRNAATCVIATRLTMLFTDFLDGSRIRHTAKTSCELVDWIQVQH